MRRHSYGGATPDARVYDTQSRRGALNRRILVATTVARAAPDAGRGRTGRSVRANLGVWTYPARADIFGAAFAVGSSVALQSDSASQSASSCMRIGAIHRALEDQQERLGLALLGCTKFWLCNRPLRAHKAGVPQCRSVTREGDVLQAQEALAEYAGESSFFSQSLQEHTTSVFNSTKCR